MKPEYALSIKQPWAFLIAKGYKDIENRNWKIGRGSQHGAYKSQTANFGITLPARVFIHAGLSQEEMHDLVLIPWVRARLSPQQIMEFAQTLVNPGLYHGGLIGEADITACVTESKSPWFEGKYGFTLENPVLYDKPIPCRGQLGFFRPNIGVSNA